MQVRLDPPTGVFEQILVDRSFAGDRHEVGSVPSRERIAVECDRHARTWLHAQGHIDAPPILPHRGGVLDLRLKVPLAP